MTPKGSRKVSCSKRFSYQREEPQKFSEAKRAVITVGDAFIPKMVPLPVAATQPLPLTPTSDTRRYFAALRAVKQKRVWNYGPADEGRLEGAQQLVSGASRNNITSFVGQPRIP